MAKWLKWTLLVLALLVIVFLLKNLKKGNSVQKVTIEAVSRRTIIETVPANGRIFPETQVRVSPDYSGQVTELRVAEGDKVKKGQLLARINDRTSIEAPIDGVVLSVKVKKGESVTGNNFSAGTEMFIIADMSLLELRVDVGENDIVKINDGDSATITVDAYNNRKFSGVVTRIANTITSNGSNYGNTTNDVSNYEVRIRLDSGSYSDLSAKSFAFRPGMNASAEIRTREKTNVLAVPIAAVNARMRGSDQSREEGKKARQEQNGNEADNATVSNDEMEEVVFIYNADGTVTRQAVKTGIQDMNYIEITQGLEEGKKVVTGPYAALTRTLKNGMKVKPVDRDKLFEK